MRTISSINAELETLDAELAADPRPSARLGQPVSAERIAWNARAEVRVARRESLLAELTGTQLQLMRDGYSICA